ncbi:hypothetical protein HBH82_016160 [Parastagonospora nodorum]|nr:hypothetical protein HBH82_016160 [Parastagonospora nodorum]KAH4713317.1 hypothetical protein HBH67_004150 [Parastagonospora nodorum]KAH4728836.1 hypothetical protein HBH78_018910 [Parastagonospora nodorum]KAH4792258.1 hypothetical protein HBH62_019340 [Parastagonospora nodorum]KAH4830740.1 hypothetical protein HBH63_032840 [Parastagonospora nodorum]
MENSDGHEGTGKILCSRCQHLNLRRFLVEHEDPGPVELGGFQEISEREDCLFCQLIIAALSAHSKSYWQGKVYPVEKCNLGRILGTSRTSRLVTWFDATSSTLPPGISGHSTTYGEILLVEQISYRRQDVQVGIARLVQESRTDFSLIHKWLHTCEEHHGPVCNLETYSPTYIRLLDLKRMCLVSGSRKYRYFTLSYVWGNMVTFQTTKSNLSELEEHGSILRLRDKFPQVIKDAISLVSALQERFLWVDALCIVQDDATDKRAQIPRMGMIYSQAAATIVSLSGKDASAGLPGVREESRRVRQCSVTISPWQLSAKLPELSVALQKSKWHTRAWTFQEAILSKRCLYFSDDQVYFQCQSGYYTEDCHGDQTRHEWGSGFSNPFKQKVPESTDSFFSTFNVYNNLVKGYSSRQHTFNSDSLNAFQGVLSSFNTLYGWHFLSALPEDVLDLALLWRPMVTADLRPRESFNCARDAACRTPTWCWTSWIGDIYWDDWRIGSYAGSTISLQPAVEQFIIATPDGFRGTRKWKRDTDSERLQVTLNDARNYMNKHKISWDESDRENNCSENMVLLFKASATDLSKLSIHFESSHLEIHPELSNWAKRARRHNAWIFDGNGRHCGTLHGLCSNWTNFHNPRLCELILLSSFSQKEVMPEDIDAHRHSLPLEYPSSDDYYNEMYDISHYRYIDSWAQNILLVEWSGNLARRVAVGQIHVDAWTTLGSVTKMIALV